MTRDRDEMDRGAALRREAAAAPQPGERAGTDDGEGGAGRPAARATGADADRTEIERRTVDDRRIESVPVAEEQRVGARRAVEVERTKLERRQHVFGIVMQGVDYLFILLYGLLAIRFVLALLGAGQQAGFVQFINGLTDPFHAPFAGIVARPSLNGGVLDFPVLIALLAYALLHLAVRGLVRLIAGSARAA